MPGCSGWWVLRIRQPFLDFCHNEQTFIQLKCWLTSMIIKKYCNIQWYKIHSKMSWTYPQTTGISCCLDVPCGKGPLEPLVTREKMTSSSKFPLSLKHFLNIWSNICRHGELNWDPCPWPGWPCWPWAAAPPIVIPVKHLKKWILNALYGDRVKF